jgi:MFS family permease
MPFKKIFLSLYSAIFISSLGLGILSPILPAYVDQFAASSTVLGLVFGAYSASRTLFMVPVGKLADRFGRKTFIITGLVLFAAVSPLYIYAATTVQLILVRMVQGLAAAMLLPVAMSYIGDLAAKGKEGLIMGTFTSAFFAGLGFGPLIGGFLRDHYSMRAAFLSMGILSLSALLITAFTLPSSETRASGFGRKDHMDPGAGGAGGDPTTIKLSALFLFRFTRALGIGFTWVLLPLYAVTTLGLSSFQVGILLSVNTFLTTLLQSAMGHLSDRFGHLWAITFGSLIGAAAISSIAWISSFEGLVVLSLMLGLAGALIVPAGSALAVEIGRVRGMGSVMGIYATSLSLGTMIGPISGGMIADAWGIRTIFPVGGVLGIAGWGVLCLVYRGQRSEALSERHR